MVSALLSQGLQEGQVDAVGEPTGGQGKLDEGWRGVIGKVSENPSFQDLSGIVGIVGICRNWNVTALNSGSRQGHQEGLREIRQKYQEEGRFLEHSCVSVEHSRIQCRRRQGLEIRWRQFCVVGTVSFISTFNLKVDLGHTGSLNQEVTELTLSLIEKYLIGYFDGFSAKGFVFQKMEATESLIKKGKGSL